MRSLDARVAQDVTDLCLASGAEAVSVAARSLETGAELLIDGDRSYHPASTFKLAVMMEAFRRAHEGTFSVDAPIRVVNEFGSIVDGSPYCLYAEDDSDPELFQDIGSDKPARELIERMIFRSSNLATNILVDLLRPEAVTAFMQRLGADGLTVRRGVEDNKAYALGLNNAATARSLATALSKLATREAVSTEADEAMIRILLAQEHNQGIPRHLPEGTLVAHKTGWNGPLYHDAAIVYPRGKSPYVLVVMTQGLDDDGAGPDLVAEISRRVFLAS